MNYIVCLYPDLLISSKINDGSYRLNILYSAINLCKVTEFLQQTMIFSFLYLCNPILLVQTMNSVSSYTWFIVKNFKGLHLQVAKIQELENLSLLQNLNFPNKWNYLEFHCELLITINAMISKTKLLFLRALVLLRHLYCELFYAMHAQQKKSFREIQRNESQ